MTEWMPIKDAAEQLGMTVDQTRRRLRAGRLKGRRVPVAQGHVWEVLMSDGDQADVRRQTPDAAHQTPDARHVASDDVPAAAMTLATARAAEMAAYSEQLLAPHLRRIEELSQQVGRLQLELEQARALAVPQTQTAAPEWPERRSWWQRLVWG